MAYDEFLAERIRSTLKKEPGITEQKAFGGLAFMLYGNMVCVEPEGMESRADLSRHINKALVFTRALPKK